MGNELSERTVIKIPIPLAITICIGLITFGGTYFALTGNIDQTENNTTLILMNEKVDRDARESIKQSTKEAHDKLERDLREFFQAEIDGLRFDWNRRYKENLDRRLTELEKLKN